MKKALSMMLVVAMVASMSSGAFALGTTGKISSEGSNLLDAAIYNYQIPINLEFAIDPFMKGDKTSQVFSGTYPIINKSDVPLSVRVSAKVTDASGNTSNPVNLKDSADKVSQVAGYTGKDLYVEAVAATAVEVGAGTTATIHATTPIPTLDISGTAPTAPVFTNGVEGTTAATLKITLNNIVANTNNDTAKTDPTFIGATIKDGTNVIGEINSLETAAATDKAVTAIGAVAKNGMLAADQVRTFYIRGNEIKMKVTTALDSADGTVTFTDVEKKLYQDKSGATPAAWPASLTLATSYNLDKGESAAVTIDTTKEKLTYPAYNETVTDKLVPGANTTGKFALTTKEKDRLWFVLDPATYADVYKPATPSNPKDPKVFSAMATAKAGLSGFRFMGSATPGADWSANDIKISATFEVAGVTPAEKAKLTALDPKAQNVFPIPASASKAKTALDLKDVWATAPAYTAVYKLPVDMGSKMASIKSIGLRPAGTLKTVAETTFSGTIAPNTGFTYNAADGVIELSVTAQKMFKHKTAPLNKGNIPNFNETTMDEFNTLKITFVDEKGLNPQDVILVLDDMTCTA